MKKLKNFTVLLVVILSLTVNVNFTLAQIIKTDKLDEQDTAFVGSAGYEALEIESIVGIVIKALLGLLSIIFIVLIILAGYNWMTAYGDESKVDKAKDTLRTSIIGLIIILAAYGITNFVLSRLLAS